MRPLQLIGTALCAIALTGCAASASPEWDSRFGNSTRALKAQQLIDPAAPARNAQQVPPTDGRTMVESGARQVESFRSPPPANIINIGVGGGGTR